MENLLYSNIVPFIILIIHIYVLFNISVIIGWFRLTEMKIDSENSQQNTFSIIIAMRNEVDNIENIINDIGKQTYLKDALEVIVVDDHSEDNSYSLVKNLGIPNLTVVKNRGEGKKDAIETALSIASNEYIIQTDADCRLNDDWVSAIAQYTKNRNYKLLIAPVVFNPKPSLISRLQELDFFALITSTAGLAGIKRPVMANGANLIYPRNIINDSDILKKHTSSGDDVFLLHYIKKIYGRQTIHFLKSKSATVTTESEDTIINLLQQRIRWASKSKYYKDFDTIAIGVLIFIINFILLSLFIASFFSRDFMNIFVIIFITKILIDSILIIPILSFYKRLGLLIYLPILSLVYPFYISFVGIISQLASFNWKGRKYY